MQVGQMPWLDSIFWKNPILNLLSKWGLWDNSFAVAQFARARMEERIHAPDPEKLPNVNKEDLLSMFLKAQQANPDFMTDKRVLTMAVSMAFAGSETTAISLASVFYYLIKNRSCLENLLNELRTAVDNEAIENRPTGLISWAEAQKLPYLDACIKEGFRMHPAAGLPLERVVPPQGATICGEAIAGGVIVGCSAWILHRRPDVFGADVDVFRPERWLEADGEKLKMMNGTMFQFGAGPRTCIGKNISLMEIYKLVPSFLRRFEVCAQLYLLGCWAWTDSNAYLLLLLQVHLCHPEKEWKLHNAWFIKQCEFETRFTAKNVQV